MKLYIMAAALAIGIGAGIPPAESLHAPAAITAKFSVKPGDTLNYRATWGKARGATGYRFTVRELWNPQGTYTGLPQGTTLTDTTALFSAISTTADSARFRAVVWSRQGNLEHPDSAWIEWSVRRLGPPGPIQIDSSLVIENIVIFPRDLTLEIVAGGFKDQSFCTIAKFHGGATAYQGINAMSVCDSVARSMGMLPTPMQQFTMDTTCFEFLVQRPDGHGTSFFVDRDSCGANARVRFTAEDN